MTTGEGFLKDERHRQGLPAPLIKELTLQGDRKAGLGITQLYGAIVLLAAFTVWAWHPLAILLVMFLIATRQQAGFVIAHDAAHYRLFRNRTLNDIAGRITGWPIC
jgi:fatty acid desaturase